MNSYNLWCKNITSAITFINNQKLILRNDDSFGWNTVGIINSASIFRSFKQFSRRWLEKIDLINKKDIWFVANSEALWETRLLLSDNKSRFSFDCAIILRITGHNKYFYLPIDADEFLHCNSSNKFISSDLPETYMGIELYIYSCALKSRHENLDIKILAPLNWISFQNTYAQYIAKFEGADFAPKLGETVFDCGCCIGEVSTMFAGMVGKTGSVHMFDPVPLHIRFCELQASNNPALSNVFKFSQFAIGEKSTSFSGDIFNTNVISPGGLRVNNFSTISLDSYINQENLKNVNYIKMDIEGWEVPALLGAKEIISLKKPRLAISAYHKDDDFWVIPNLIKSLNSDYKLYFSHHSPVSWESVFYAI